MDEYPASDLVKPTVVIDIRDRCIDNRDYALSPSDLVAWEGNHGKVEPDTLVLLLTGWSDRWNDRKTTSGPASMAICVFLASAWRRRPC